MYLNGLIVVIQSQLLFSEYCVLCVFRDEHDVILQLWKLLEEAFSSPGVTGQSSPPLSIKLQLLQVNGFEFELDCR